MPFINRTSELKRLDQWEASSSSEFLVVYGRRRIGKTALLTNWLSVKYKGKFTNWVAYKTSSELLLASFSEDVLGQESDELSFQSWEAAFRHVFKLAKDKRYVLVIDEFPYLIQSNPEIPSLLQKIWDSHGKNSNIVLVLCGSHYHMMVDQLFSARQPLYGRATGTLMLDEVKPDELDLFLPGYSINQIAQTAAIIGGVPHYLNLWDSKKPPLKNLEDLMLSNSTLFRHEALFLIQEELPEPRTYLAILEALGSGLLAHGEIAKRSGLDSGHVGKYLNTLVKLRFVRKVISADVEKQSNTRRSRYEIHDPYLRFYFEFIYKHPNWIEQGRVNKLRSHIETRLDAYVGKQVYETWARSKILEMGDLEQLSFIPDEVGRAWSPKVEIDLLAVNWKDQVAIVGECKWQREKIKKADLESLKSRAKHLDRIKGFAIQFALFSKSGFVKSLIEIADQEGVMLFEGADFTKVA